MDVPLDRFSANISMLFTELPYLERPAAARDSGFTSIESWWPFKGAAVPAADLQELVRALRDADIELDALNAFAGDMAAGERGVACRPDRQDELDANVEQLLVVAEKTGCRNFNLLYGQLEDGPTETEQHQCALEAVRRVAERLGTIGGTVLLEPLARGLNGRYPLQTGDDVVELLEGPLAETWNVALLFDLFHLGSNDVDLTSAAQRLLRWIGHVQIADSPGRGEPGTGALAIVPTLRVLLDGGYTGLIGCEYAPTVPTAQSLAWMEVAA